MNEAFSEQDGIDNGLGDDLALGCRFGHDITAAAIAHIACTMQQNLINLCSVTS
jgi:hypothetical protein